MRLACRKLLVLGPCFVHPTWGKSNMVFAGRARHLPCILYKLGLASLTRETRGRDLLGTNSAGWEKVHSKCPIMEDIAYFQTRQIDHIHDCFFAAF